METIVISMNFRTTNCFDGELKREIEIIGEAMNRILKTEPDLKIKNARQIVDTRNWVIHNYDNVDDVIIWGIVINHLPKLQIEINSLLEN